MLCHMYSSLKRAIHFSLIPICTKIGGSFETFRLMSGKDKARMAYVGVGFADLDGPPLPPIIMLHGMSSTKETWREFLRPIAEATNRMVLSVDARNYGESGWTSEYYYDLMMDDIKNLMKCTNIDKATFIGHSMGGKTAMYFALEEPEKVEKLIIEDIHPKILGPSYTAFPIMYIERMKRALKELPAETVDLDEAKKFVAEYLAKQLTPEHRSERNVPLDHSSLPLQKSDKGFEWQINFDVIEKRLPHGDWIRHEVKGVFNGPALFLCGTRSPYDVIKEKDYILKLFPNATFKFIEGAKHLLHAEYPEEFLEKVVEFLKNSDISRTNNHEEMNKSKHPSS